MSNSRLKTPKEASAYLGAAVPTLAKWRAQRTYNLVYVKIGGKVYYDQADLDRFIESRKVQPDAA